jgi:asparagine synthase (glutamine-hydrolysing)
MCGITGFADFTSSVQKEVLVKMAGALQHRGPDDAGIELIETSKATVGFGFRRLSILDLSPAGHQPMRDSHSNNLIVFNGEIYNFKEIRAELESGGYSFTSTGDTEVILAAYRKWGKNCVSRFIGMFAICIYDRKENKLICFRDRAGVKPFFYYHTGDTFLFASELKCFHEYPSFKAVIDRNSLGYFFKHGCITAPYTIFQNTFKLRPGYLLEVDLSSGKVIDEMYWSVDEVYDRAELTKMTLKEASDDLDKLFRSAFNYRMVSDVPVGLFLSGGYDSSCVAAILQTTNSSRIKTYTIGFEEKGYDEAPHAKKVAEHLGTDHHEHYCTAKEGMDFIPILPDVYDEPFGDSSAIPTLLVSKAARESVTVALSADGGDELFAGYPRHRKSLQYINRFSVLPLRKLIATLIPVNAGLEKPDIAGKLKEVLRSGNQAQMFDLINQTFTEAEVDNLLSEPTDELISPYSGTFQFSSHVTALSAMLALEYKTYLADDILQKVDRATMSVSLEGREPFLDHRIVEFAATLPDHYKMNGKEQKIILKDIVHRYIPENIMRRPKMGFGVPAPVWLKRELKELFMTFMSDDAIRANPYLNFGSVVKLRQAYLDGKLENFERIWFVFIFQMWYNRWIMKIA